MEQFIEKKFVIPTLKGISQKTIDEHLKLYAGYVKNANLILEIIEMYSKVTEIDAKGAIGLSEAQRRFGFEFDGMRNHEYYFEQFENGAVSLSNESVLKNAIEKEWGSFDAWLARFKTVAMTRGIGWAVLYYDAITDKLVHAWVDEQHLGQLTGTHFILGLDMWEHSYMLDYVPSEKKNYIDAFFENINWQNSEDRFTRAKK